MEVTNLKFGSKLSFQPETVHKLTCIPEDEFDALIADLLKAVDSDNPESRIVELLRDVADLQSSSLLDNPKVKTTFASSWLGAIGDAAIAICADPELKKAPVARERVLAIMQKMLAVLPPEGRA